MDSRNPSRVPNGTVSRPPSPKQLYLTAYNAGSAVLWTVVLVRTLSTGLSPSSPRGWAGVYDAVGEWTKWTQTLALAEVAHAALGLVRAPLLTTAIQIASRFLLVWGIVDPFPVVARTPPPFYASMLLAWSVTEVIRYTYFTFLLGSALFEGVSSPGSGRTTAGVGRPAGVPGVPRLLTWLRYNTFFVLYPVGIVSEWALVFLTVHRGLARHGDAWWWRVGNSSTNASPGAGLWGLWYERLLVLVMGIYVPGAYVMYTHMMGQRRKVMKANAVAGTGSKKLR